MKDGKDKTRKTLIHRSIGVFGLVLLISNLLGSILISSCQREVRAPDTGEVDQSNRATITSGNFRIELTTTKKQFKSNEFIPLKLTVRNTSSSTVVIRFSSGQKYDFAVRTEAGEEVWRWSKGRMFTQMIEEIELPSQGGRNFFEKIEGGTLKPGKYTISAVITAAEFTNQGVEVKIEVI